ncbi:MAG: hypothetical protein HY401_01050 [Elusimicrobia bacterium]|nr:hypothetical protein [Elusimicrobiota bacterium]
MKKILIYGGGAALGLGAIVLVVLYFNLGAIVKTAVETFGPRVTQTEVRVRSVALSPFSGRGRVKGVFIGNPPGFKTPSAFELSEVLIEVDLKSFGADKVVIKKIVVEGPVITIEGGLSSNNLSKIQKNAQAFSPAPVGSRDKKPQKETRLEIGLFAVKNGRVNVSLTGMGAKTLKVSLPDMEIKDIGKQGKGATAGEAAQKIMGAVIKAALGAGAGAGTLTATQDAAEGALNKIKGLFKKQK